MALHYDPITSNRVPAPTPGLRRLEEFVNTNDIEEERDLVATPEKLGRWLSGRGALSAGEIVSPATFALAMDVREGLRALGRVNNGEPLEQERVDRLNAAAARLPFVASVSGGGGWQLAAPGQGVEGYLSRLLADMVEAMADGSWSRMKACRNDGCRWLFYDHSRNRSGTWCTMAICGSRVKSRAYRARQRKASTGS